MYAYIFPDFVKMADQVSRNPKTDENFDQTAPAMSDSIESEPKMDGAPADTVSTENSVLPTTEMIFIPSGTDKMAPKEQTKVLGQPNPESPNVPPVPSLTQEVSSAIHPENQPSSSKHSVKKSVQPAFSQSQSSLPSTSSCEPNQQIAQNAPLTAGFPIPTPHDFYGAAQNVEILGKYANMDPNDRLGGAICVFYTKSPFSDFLSNQFLVDGRRYYSVEHYFQVQMLNSFGLYRLANDLMSESDVTNFRRRLKDELRGMIKTGLFDEKMFSKWKISNVVRMYNRANKAKFEQHQELKQLLLNTGDRVLVFTSKKDRLCGVGMTEAEFLLWVRKNKVGFRFCFGIVFSCCMST